MSFDISSILPKSDELKNSIGGSSDIMSSIMSLVEKFLSSIMNSGILGALTGGDITPASVGKGPPPDSKPPENYTPPSGHMPGGSYRDPKLY